MPKDKIHPYRKYILFSILFFVLGILIFLFLYREIGENKYEESLILEDWQKEAIQRDEIKLLNRSMASIKESKSSLESHFVSSSDVVPFLDTLEATGKSVMSKIEVEAVEVPKDKEVLAVSVRFSGSFEGIYKFIKLVENLPYEVEIVGFDIRKDLSSLWEGSMRLHLVSFIK